MSAQVILILLGLGLAVAGFSIADRKWTDPVHDPGVLLGVLGIIICVLTAIVGSAHIS